MKQIINILLLTALSTSLAPAQTPKKIHDLKSLTDSSGTVHLFYRIYEEYESTDYFRDNIYHYDTQTGEQKVIIESYFDDRLGFEYNVNVTDYKFLANDPFNFVYTTIYCDGVDCFGSLSRSDSVDIIGGYFASMEHLNVEGPDTGRVYIELQEEVIIGRNGGRDWPIENTEYFDEIPDSSKLDFPLTSLSPYNDSLMFGKRYSFGSDDNGFFRSQDKGNTSEFVSDTLYGNTIQYDINEETIYLLDTIGAPSSDQNCSLDPCKYGLYRSNAKGESGSWEIRKVFSQNAILIAHHNESGKLYAWNADSVLITEDYGENFEILINSAEEITGFTATPSGEYYTTNSALYKIEGEDSVELFSIPVSNEAEIGLPKEFELLQNYPNPFNPVTTITYRMRAAGVVTIELYTIQGQRVKKLVNDYKTEGQHSFRLNGSDLASGIYILRGKLGAQTESRTITLVK